MPIDAATLISAIAPVLLVLALGFAAGKHRSFDDDQTRGLSHLALTYALPAALFLSMAHFSRQTLIEQAPVALVMLVGYSGLYLLLYWLLRGVGMARLKAALLGYTFSSSAVPVYGLTVLTPIYGPDTGSAVVGLVALITNLAQVSIAVFLLESASAPPGKDVSIFQALGRSAANPLVWAPVLGGAIALTGVHLSPYIATTLEPLAAAASGVSIFACGLVLASHRVTVSPLVLLGSLVVLALQPVLFFAAMKAGGLSGLIANATVVASAFPTATISILFARQYRTAEAEIATIMLVTTVGMVAAIPLSLVASGYL
ncbi:MAG TPA: AEC family transporter [Sphingomicrobium sp.]|nr:AEC family transporter [Sphingomicrobium sp.]